MTGLLTPFWPQVGEISRVEVCNDDALTKGPGTHLDTTPGADTMDSSLHEDLKPGQKVRGGNGVTFLVKICLPTPEQAGGSGLPRLCFLFYPPLFSGQSGSWPHLC